MLDDELVERMKFCAQTLKIIVEPAGILGLTGAKHCGLDLKDKKVGVIISGGNIDISKYTMLLAEHESK